MKTTCLQLKIPSSASTSIENFSESMVWLKTSRSHVNIQWSITSKVLPYLVPRMVCVHQSQRHATSLQSKSHGKDPVVSMHSLKSSSPTSALTNFLLRDKILPTGECFLAVHMQRFTVNCCGYRFPTVRICSRSIHQQEFSTMLFWQSPKVLLLIQ